MTSLDEALSRRNALHFVVQRVDAEEPVQAQQGKKHSTNECRPTRGQGLQELKNHANQHDNHEENHFRVIFL